MSNAQQFVIKVENGEPISHPLLYSNFLLLHPCPPQSTPTNDVIGQYGYEVFIPSSPPPRPSPLFHPGVVEKYVKIDGAWTQQWMFPLVDEADRQGIIDEGFVVLRNMRNFYLRLTDWTQLLDVPLSEEDRSTWAIYRQALRDLTNDLTDPFNIVWPTPPTPLVIPKPIMYNQLQNINL